VLYPEASELGIGVVLCDALIILCLRYPDGVTMSTLAESMRVEASTATRTVDRMVEKRIAQRVRSDADGRVALVKPTRWGLALQDRLTKGAARTYETILQEEFDARELETLAGMLERLEAVFERCAQSDS
jgi:DNA-binding MarR family transcriptional regulator